MTAKTDRNAILEGSFRKLGLGLAMPPEAKQYLSHAEMAASIESVLTSHDLTEDLWVFGYGSLIWNPAFHFIETRVASLYGWHRRFCLKLYLGRGSPECPGLTLALDRGGSCSGLAFRIKATAVCQELGVLWQREMFAGAYDARWVQMRDKNQVTIKALAFVVNRRHPLYLGDLSLENSARMIAEARGELGPCREYLGNTIEKLKQYGIEDSALNKIANIIETKF